MWGRRKESSAEIQYDQAKNEYEAAVSRLHNDDHVRLAICSANQLVAFNARKSMDGERAERRGYAQISGLLVEHGQMVRHVRCDIDLNPTLANSDRIGGMSLTHMGHDQGSGKRCEERVLTVTGAVEDFQGRIFNEVLWALRDAALAGDGFIHIDFETAIDRPDAATSRDRTSKALDSLRSRGFCTGVPIFAVKMATRITLASAPSFAKSSPLD